MNFLHPETSQRQRSERRQPSCQKESDDLMITLQLLTVLLLFLLLLLLLLLLSAFILSTVAKEKFRVQEELQEATQGLARPSENQDDTRQLRRCIGDPSQISDTLSDKLLAEEKQKERNRIEQPFLPSYHAQPRSGETASIARIGKAYDEDESSGSNRDEGIRRLMSQRMRLRPARIYMYGLASTLLNAQWFRAIAHERSYSNESRVSGFSERSQVSHADTKTEEDKNGVESKAEEISDSPDATEEDRRALGRECAGCNSDLFRSGCVEEGNPWIRLKCSACEETFCAPNTSEQQALLGQKFGVPCGKAFVESFDQIAEGGLSSIAEARDSSGEEIILPEQLANEWELGETRKIAEPKRAANDAVRKWNENLRRYCAVQPLERIEDVAPGDLLVFSGGPPVRFDCCALSLAVDRSGGVLRVARLVEEKQPPHRLEVSDLRLDASELKGAAVVRFQPQDCLSSEKTVRLAKSFAAENDWVLELDYSEACRLFASWCKTGSIRRRVPILFYESPVIVATAAVSAIAAITGAAHLIDFLRSTFRDVA